MMARSDIKVTVHLAGRFQRQLNMIEALGCWILAEQYEGVAAGVWWVMGFLALFGFWGWLERQGERLARWVAERS